MSDFYLVPNRFILKSERQKMKYWSQILQISVTQLLSIFVNCVEIQVSLGLCLGCNWTWINELKEQFEQGRKPLFISSSERSVGAEGSKWTVAGSGVWTPSPGILRLETSCQWRVHHYQSLSSAAVKHIGLGCVAPAGSPVSASI